MAEEKGKVIGHGPCPHCGTVIPYKLNKKGHVYAYCLPVPDGCMSSTMARSAVSDKHLAARITKWSDPAARASILGGGGEEPRPAKSIPWYERDIL